MRAEPTVKKLLVKPLCGPGNKSGIQPSWLSLLGCARSRTTHKSDHAGEKIASHPWQQELRGKTRAFSKNASEEEAGHKDHGGAIARGGGCLFT